MIFSSCNIRARKNLDTTNLTNYQHNVAINFLCDFFETHHFPNKFWMDFRRVLHVIIFYLFLEVAYLSSKTAGYCHPFPSSLPVTCVSHIVSTFSTKFYGN